MSAKRFSNPLDLTGAHESLRARFWSKVSIGAPDECWEWTEYRKPSGYGQFVLRKGVFLTASRVSLAFTTPLAAGEVACHKCDNPPCVNPAHLFKGTQRDNNNDAIAKGRARRSFGEAHRDARLTPADVRYIRAQDVGQRGRKSELAREFGVSLTAIRRVLARQTWRSVA